PTAGAAVAGVTPLAATAGDDRGVTRVEFTVDGAVVGTATQPPYQVSWDARTVTPGVHTLGARAVDAAGNTATSTSEVTVVTDTTPPSTPTGLTASPPAPGQVTLGWQPSTDDIAVAGYELLRDGAVIATPTTTTVTDTAAAAGHTYRYTVKARDTSDNLSPPSTPVTVTVPDQSAITVDTIVTTHQTSAAAAITSPAFSTSKPGDLLVAFLASDGPTTSAQSFSAVAGGGLSWRLRQRANTWAGTAEIWTATAPSALSNARVTATRARGSYLGSLTVVAFSGADTATDGATAAASAATGAPTVQLTTTHAGSWVWAVGEDWDRAVPRTVPSGQTLVDQFLASVGDTFWVQQLDAPTPSAGTTVTINDTAPTTDRWNLTAIEILPTTAPPPDATPPTASISVPADGVTVSGPTAVTATASDNVAVTKLEFYVDGTLAATDTTAPYAFTWDTTAVTDGAHQLTVKAYDAAGNEATSTAVTVTVANMDGSPPTAPTGLDATAAGPTEVRLTWAASSDNVGVTGYAILRDGEQVGTATGTSYRDTTVQADTTYSYAVTAYDAAGNVSSPSLPATVSTPALPPRDTTAPTVELTAPANGATVSGPTAVTASASDNVGVTKVDFFVDGTLAASDTTAPYGFAWGSATVTDGSHQLTAKAYDAAGNDATSTTVTVTVANANATTLGVDALVTTHQTQASTTITSPAFSTTKPGDLLVAFVTSDGARSTSQSFRTVAGGGLTWRLRQRANAQAGTAEIWTATAASTLSGARVTATRARGSYLGSLTVVAFSGADTVTGGATAAASAATGAPSVKLTTTRAGSWVWAVGEDWDRAVARTVPQSQTLVDQFLASVADTFWAQRLDATTPAAGTTVTIYDIAPTTDRWDLAAIEIRPR
ncbi:MAG TPA: Ig-like domain-containing protein, partial [Mycobacterium sp.]